MAPTEPECSVCSRPATHRALPAPQQRYQQPRAPAASPMAAAATCCPSAADLRDWSYKVHGSAHRPMAPRASLSPNNARVEQGPQHRRKETLQGPSFLREFSPARPASQPLPFSSQATLLPCPPTGTHSIRCVCVPLRLLFFRPPHHTPCLTSESPVAFDCVPLRATAKLPAPPLHYRRIFTHSPTDSPRSLDFPSDRPSLFLPLQLLSTAHNAFCRARQQRCPQPGLDLDRRHVCQRQHPSFRGSQPCPDTAALAHPLPPQDTMLCLVSGWLWLLFAIGKKGCD